MATSTSNAVGMAKQFTDRPDKVYIKQQVGVPLNWNVGVSRNYDYDNISRGLLALGVQLGDNSLQHEKNLSLIAESTAPHILANMSEEDRHKLNAVQILSESGNFELAENPYAVAVIDNIKGGELSRRIVEDYRDYRKTQELKGSLPEEIESFENFYESALQMYEGQDHIDNQWAFEKGLSENHIKGALQVEEEYRKDKNLKIRVERAEGLMRDIGEATRNTFNQSVEDINNNVSLIYAKYRLTQTNDVEFNIKLLKGMVNTVAQNVGNKGIEAIKDIEIEPNKKLSEVIDLNEFKNLANRAEDFHYTNNYNEALKKLQSFTTVQAFDKYIKELQEKDPEMYNVFSSNLDSFRHSVVSQERHRQEMLARQQAKMAKIAMSQGIAPLLINATLNGHSEFEYMGKKYPVAQSMSDLSKMGLDEATVAPMYTQALRQAIKDRNSQGIGKLLANPIAMEFTKRYIGNTLSNDLATWDGTTDVPESINFMFNIGDLSPDSMRGIAGEENTGKLLALKTLIKTYSQAKGASIYHRALEQVGDSRFTQEFNKGFNFTTASVYDIESQSMRSVDITTGDNFRAYNDVKTTAKYLNASGSFTLSESIKQASEDALSGYFSYKGNLIPMDFMREMTDNPREDTNAQQKFIQTIEKYRTQMAKQYNKPLGQTVVTYDSSSKSLVFKVYGSNIYQKIDSYAFQSEAYGKEESSTDTNTSYSPTTYGTISVQEAYEDYVD